MTHPHKDLIIALLDDPELEVEQICGIGTATYISNPTNVLADLLGQYQFRLREKPKPDVVRYVFVTAAFSDEEQSPGSNLRLTFTADGTLKSAEVL